MVNNYGEHDSQHATMHRHKHTDNQYNYDQDHYDYNPYNDGQYYNDQDHYDHDYFSGVSTSERHLYET